MHSFKSGLFTLIFAALLPVQFASADMSGMTPPSMPTTGVTNTANMVNSTATDAASTLQNKKDSLAAKALVNINTASKEDLAKLPGIGDKRADAIIQARPFKSPEDLMKVKGIKEGLYNKLKSHITI
jgi:competence ComEA-like helix-hairpin-helix protein